MSCVLIQAKAQDASLASALTRQIDKRAHQRATALGHKRSDEVEDAELVAGIKGSDGFIGDEERCLGGKGTGTMHAGQFAPGQCIGAAMGQMAEIASHNRALNGVGIRLSQAAKGSPVTEPAKGHHVAHTIGPGQRPLTPWQILPG